MRRMIYIFCLLAASCCLAQSAATARLGTLGKNDSVVTSVTFGGPASQLTDGTNIITSARDVLRILAEDEPWSFTVSPTLPEGAAIGIAWGPTLYFPDDEQWYALVDYPGGGGPFPLGGSESSTNLVLVSTFAESSPEYTVIFTRHLAGETNFVGRLALTNDIPEVGPSAPAWDVAALDHIAYTNGMVDVTFSSTLMAVTNGWPDGASVFLRLHPSQDSYIPADPLRLVGYGVWPTNEAQAVAWRSGTNVFVNVILEVR